MAKRSTVADLFPNRAFESVTMSAANALTFSQVQFGVGLFQGIAAIISRIEWFPTAASMAELTTSGDDIECALTNRDDLTSILPTSQNVLAHKGIVSKASGTPATLLTWELPLVSDFSSMGGGGLIVPANPLYIALETLGAAAASVLNAVIYLTFKELSDAEYVELIQTIMPANL